MNDMWLVVRTDGDAATLAPALRARIWRLDADLPLDEVGTMRELLGASVAEPRFNATLLAAFAVTALLLAAVGVYGVLSYAVAQRTSEIGVRMALGARRWQLLRVVVGEGVALALAGVVVGVVASLGTGRLLASLLHGVSVGDPMILGGAAATLTLVALAAAALPAWRASRVDPVVALRYD
jgi:ABC-type antimicrobial peptide transport system permease subunit